MRKLILIMALFLAGCAAITTGDAVDLASTSYALNAGAHEAGTAMLCGTHPAAIIACSFGLKEGAKIALTEGGYTKPQAARIISTAGWLGAGSNAAVIAGATLPQGLIVGSIAAIIYHETTKPQE